MTRKGTLRSQSTPNRSRHGHHFSLSLRETIMAGFLATLSILLQASGNIIPFIGLLISPFSTLPILIVSSSSPLGGFLAYLTCSLVLLITAPSEAIIFFFTTGLIGVTLGGGLFINMRTWVVCIAGAIALTSGILFTLYILEFPLLGGNFGYDLNVFLILAILLFSLFYSLLWTRLYRLLMRKIPHFKKKRGSK